MVGTGPAGSRGWTIRAFENESAQSHQAVFRSWAVCGERRDYAWVDLLPPLAPSETGAPVSLTRVLLAPRHEGIRLTEPPKEWPIHVYVLSVPETLVDAEEVPPDIVKIRLWAILLRDLSSN